MRSWQVRFRLVIAAVALVMGGCTDDGGTTDSSGGPSEARSDPQEVRIVAVDYGYTEVPVELEAGVINLTFENQGTVSHEATLSGIGDTPIDRFVEDLGGRTGLEGLPFPDYLDQVAVPPFVSVEGGATGEATFTLTEGRYALWCSITDVARGDEKAPHYELGMVRELTVSRGDTEPGLPVADGTITAIDYAFELDLEAGDRSVTFINEGPDQVHLTTVEVYPEGIDAAAAEDAFETQLEPGRLPEGVPSVEAALGFSGIFSEGLGSRFELDGEFESGRTYLFVCLVPDREGGESHAVAYDMYAVVTIE
jgi:uncharacterized cupredoxin-like copper-binding protein